MVTVNQLLQLFDDSDYEYQTPIDENRKIADYFPPRGNANAAMCWQYLKIKEAEIEEEDRVLTGGEPKMYIDLDWLCEVYDAEYTVRIGEAVSIKTKIYDSDEAAGIYKILNRDKIIVAFTDFSNKPQVGIFTPESDIKYIIKDGYVFISAKLKYLR